MRCVRSNHSAAAGCTARRMRSPSADGRTTARPAISRTSNSATANGQCAASMKQAGCFSILGGIGSAEELLIPARELSSLGPRMLGVEKRQRSDPGVIARSGVVGTPGQTGSFENGAGLFASRYEESGAAMQSIGIWDRIGPGVCHWRQQDLGARLGHALAPRGLTPHRGAAAPCSRMRSRVGLPLQHDAAHDRRMACPPCAAGRP
jgi:hypothetical protein